MDDREVLLRSSRDARSLQQFVWFCAFIGCWFVFGMAVNALIVLVLISFVVAALFVWLAVRDRRIGVTREGSELVVRNAFRTRRVPLNEIVEVGVESGSTPPHVYVRR